MIRSKPEGVSGEEHAQSLACQWSNKQTDWREKATHLERELLRNRQELAKYQLSSQLLATRGASAQVTVYPNMFTSNNYAHVLNCIDEIHSTCIHTYTYTHRLIPPNLPSQIVSGCRQDTSLHTLKTTHPRC